MTKEGLVVIDKTLCINSVMEGVYLRKKIEVLNFRH